jgi:predicted dehydrogenase
MYKVGVIGCGYWGKNVIRNFVNHPDCNVTHLCDTDPSKLDQMRIQYQKMNVFCSDPMEVVASNVDIVAIVTPPETHFAMAKEALQHNKHVFLEKPATITTIELDQLLLLQKHNKVVVDSTFLYTPEVQYLRYLIQNGKLGSVVYGDSIRTNLGLFQKSVNVLYDLAVHDIAIFNYILSATPNSMEYQLYYSHKELQPSIGYLILHYCGTDINIHVSWFNPLKTRKITLCGTGGMCVYDLQEPKDKIKLYDRGVKVINNTLQYYDNGIISPQFDNVEPLTEVITDLIESIRTNTQPVSSLLSSRDVIVLLETAK